MRLLVELILDFAGIGLSSRGSRKRSRRGAGSQTDDLTATTAAIKLRYHEEINFSGAHQTTCRPDASLTEALICLPTFHSTLVLFEYNAFPCDTSKRLDLIKDGNQPKSSDDLASLAYSLLYLSHPLLANAITDTTATGEDFVLHRQHKIQTLQGTAACARYILEL